ncbi:MAG: lamin tail domain-containing protein [bacterium]
MKIGIPLALAAGAALAACAAAAAAPSPRDGSVDPPRRSPFAPAGPLRVLGGITPISQVAADDANGLASLGEFTLVTVRGVVQSATGQLDPYDHARASNWFYVSDGTASVAISRVDSIGVAAAVGDSVEIGTFVFTQRFVPLRGTRTLDLAQGFGLDHVTILAAGRPTRPAHAIPADSLVAQGARFEGELVKVGGLTIVDGSEWPAAGSSAFVRATDGADTVRILVDKDTDLAGITPPSGAFAITGFVSQDDPNVPGGSNGPFLSGHYVYPRSRSDISQGDGSGTAVVSPTFVTEGAGGLSLTFTFAGQTSTLETVDLALPASWTWAASSGNLTLSGAGFSSASASFAPQGGGWAVTVSGAAVTASATGTLVVSALAAPPVVESSTFLVRTAVAAGTPTAILVSPVVEVVSNAVPGDVVINELYPRTTDLTGGFERSEFVEVRNVSGRDLVIGGWTLADIGRTAHCTTDSRWAFPAGTLLPSGGFAVVCQTARDTQSGGAGFLADFPKFPSGVPLFETFDPSYEAPSADDPGTPNMVLVDATPQNDQMQLLGGPNTNVGQCESPNVAGLLLPFEELVALRNALGAVVDVVEYRNPGPCPQDLCTTTDVGGTGPNDAYAFGAPKVGHTLGRDAASTDTGVSSADLRPSSTPTPGLANIPGDTVPPVLATPAPSLALSAKLLEIRYDEPVVDALAIDPARYSITLAGGGGVAVREVLRDAADPLVHYFLSVDALPAGGTASLRIQGVTDIPFGGSGNAIDTTVAFPVPADAVSVCDVQRFDESGISPHTGETVTIAGYVTVAPSETDRISIWVQEPGADGCGVNVFSFAPTAGDTVTLADYLRYGIRQNDLVQIRGRITEFISSTSGAGAVTELSAIDGVRFHRFLARGLAGPAPRVVSTRAANDEALEGTLVRTVGTVINSNALAAFIDDGSGSIQVFQNFSTLDLTRYTVGDRLDVTGVITQFDSTEPYLSGYELVPQAQDAIVRADVGFSANGPQLRVPHRVLVPQLGEKMEIVTNTPPRSDVIVEIYDSLGRKVTTLYDGVGLGEMKLTWDGRSQNGEIVDPGVYLCHVRAVALDGGSVKNETAPVVVGLRLNGGGAR